jgi:adenylate cyclase
MPTPSQEDPKRMSVPQLSVLEADPGGWSLPEAAPAAAEDLFEAAVLFSDMRGSSDLITRMAPRDFFHLLNGSLSAQADCVRGFGGEVVKYTGDGAMAVFRGIGRASFALRCALELARACERLPNLPFGIGLADGPVLAGFVGPDGPGERRHHDVIGATVHLAARLCAMAASGEVLTTSAVHAASRLRARGMRSMGAVAVPGFPGAIDCVAFERGAAGPAL